MPTTSLEFASFPQRLYPVWIALCRRLSSKIGGNWWINPFLSFYKNQGPLKPGLYLVGKLSAIPYLQMYPRSQTSSRCISLVRKNENQEEKGLCFQLTERRSKARTLH